MFKLTPKLAVAIILLSAPKELTYYVVTLAAILTNKVKLNVTKIRCQLQAFSKEIGYSDLELLTVTLGKKVKDRGDNREPNLRQPREGDYQEPKVNNN